MKSPPANVGGCRSSNNEVMKMTTYINDLRENSNPFMEEYGVEDYRAMDDVLDVEIDIYAIKAFENQNGPGVYILAKENGIRGEFFYMCTHSLGITGILTKPKVMEAVEKEPIRATITKRKSKNSDRTVYAFA